MSIPILLPADEAGLAQAVARLTAGEPVAVPTETVYGLAARADRAEAVAAIYRAKGRPDFNPLIVHVSDVAAAEKLALVDERARALAQAFWPGALTMVLPRREGLRWPRR
jgi:L-threonylcarbamoyladenylate synthase